MNISLTVELERLLKEKAEQSGLDANTYVARLLRDALDANGDAENGAHEGAKPRKPISERFEEIRQQAPEEVQQALSELPTDFAAEHDHYIYGTPKKHS